MKITETIYSNLPPPLLVLYQRYKCLFFYCLIGCSGASLDFIFFYLLTKEAGLYYQYANCISVSVGIVNNFIWNSRFNFKLTSCWWLRLISFYGIGLIGLGLSALLLHVLINLLNYNEYFAKFLVIGIVTAIQFSLNKYITFRRRENIDKCKTS